VKNGTQAAECEGFSGWRQSGNCTAQPVFEPLNILVSPKTGSGNPSRWHAAPIAAASLTSV